MQTLTVHLSDRSYPILIGSNLLQSQTCSPRIFGRDVLLISNTIVAPLYADRSGRRCRGGAGRVILPMRGAQDTASASRIFDVMIANRLGRTSSSRHWRWVVGDLSDSWRLLPARRQLRTAATTLLADVDSAVGARPVNHPGGKNMIGAFISRGGHHRHRSARKPARRELSAGLAESSSTPDPRRVFFDWLEPTSKRSSRATRARWRMPSPLLRDQGRSSVATSANRAIARYSISPHLRSRHRTLPAMWSAARRAVGWADRSCRPLAASRQLEPGQLRRLVSLLERRACRSNRRRSVRARIRLHARRQEVKSGRVRLILLRGIGDAVMTADYPDAALQSTLAAQFGRECRSA